jgi:hypothetical protein
MRRLHTDRGDNPDPGKGSKISLTRNVRLDNNPDPGKGSKISLYALSAATYQCG